MYRYGKLSYLADNLIGYCGSLSKNFEVLSPRKEVEVLVGIVDYYDGKWQVHYIGNGANDIKSVQNVPAGVTPLYIGNGQSNVGTYQVTARLIQDSTRTLLKELVATITIKPASGQNPDDGNGDVDDEQPIDVSMVVFADDKVEYDGNAHSLTATNVPTGVTPQYEGNNKVEVGIYTVTCKLYDANNKLLATLHATLEIIEKEVETDPNDVSKVIFANKTVTYNGESHSITALNVPSTVRPEYEGNDKVEVGTYTITCKLYSTEGQLLATLTATLKINDPVDVQLPLV